MKALISDIHANCEALSAVLDDIGKHDVTEIICLGDIVGYGPQPAVCTDMVREQCRLVIQGNHDHALIHGPVGFNYVAAGAIFVNRAMMAPQEQAQIDCENPLVGDGLIECCRDRMLPKCFEIKSSKRELWEFIDHLPPRHTAGHYLYVHGSPLEPTFEYIFPDKFFAVWQPERIRQLFTAVPWLAFCGHTHHPCVIDANLTCHYPVDQPRFQLERDRKYIINVGSVGQPRDGDSRACYLLFDEEQQVIEWRRVEYDIAAVIAKIEQVCGLDSRCGSRLLKGL